MRYLFFLAIVFLALMLWRNSRQGSASGRPRQTPPEGGPQEMVRCAHCGLHLPRADAVTGRQGMYCSNEHRQLSEA